MVSRIVIDRWECSFLSSLERGWLLVYGRRKTGKTWLLKRCVDWAFYATITSSGDCIALGRDKPALEVLGLRNCLEKIAYRLRRREQTIVLDEFQRLPAKYWDLIGSLYDESEGKLIACGSSLGVASRIYERSSPLLGVFTAFRVDIASLPDTIASLAKTGLEPRESVLWAILVRDPWILGHIEPRGEPWKALAREAPRLAPVARGLIGEVFEEEERQLTRLYDSILVLLARGYWRAADIAQALYSQGLVSAPHPGTATGPLKVLESMGLVERIPLWRTRGARIYYRHRSPLLSLLYSVRDIVEELGAPASVESLAARYGLEAQFGIGEILAEAKKLQRAYSIPARGQADIDVLLVDKKKKPVWGYEVKIGRIDPREAVKAVNRLKKAGILFAGLVSLHEKPPALGDEALGPEDIVEMSKKLSAEKRKTSMHLEERREAGY